jgi:hypothetical protein
MRSDKKHTRQFIAVENAELIDELVNVVEETAL